MSPKKEEKDDFEAKMSRLDDIVGELESGEVPLEKAIALFEEGLLLSQKCTRLLEEAQQRVQKLLERVDGEADVQAMEPPS